MAKLTDHDRKVLQYVENTAGNATMDIFEDDWSPIGRSLLFDLGPMGRRLIHMPYDEKRGRQFVHLTPAGRSALAEQPE